MTITLCGSIKFMDSLVNIQKQLEKMGHVILMPIKADGVDYWSEDNSSRVEAKKKFGFIGEHFKKIEKSDAILIVNVTKNETINYIGANTFLEMGLAHHWGKKIYCLNPLPDQTYIRHEIESIAPVVLNGDLAQVA